MQDRTKILAAAVVFSTLVAGCERKEADDKADSAKAPAAASPAVDKKAAEKTIRQGDSVWLRSVNSKNIDSLMALYSSDAIALNDGVPMAKGTDAIKASYVGMFKANPHLEINPGDIKFSEDGTLAYETGSYTGTMDGPGGKPMKVGGDYLTVYRNDGGTWKAVADMNNSTMPPGK